MAKPERIICPFHAEKTPSMMVNEAGFGYCFGCGVRATPEMLGRKRGVFTPSPKKEEDIERTLQRIAGLPRRRIRGLMLPCDDRSYYVVWPDLSYYKRRFFDTPEGKGKYYGPVGIEKPLFALRLSSAKNAIIIEGEINALSLAQALPEDSGIDILSPGGVNDFCSKTRLERDLQIYRRYQTIVIGVDADGVGINAGINLKMRLLPLVRKVTILPWPKKQDANDVLTQEGEKALVQRLQGYLELPPGLQPKCKGL